MTPKKYLFKYYPKSTGKKYSLTFTLKNLFLKIHAFNPFPETHASKTMLNASKTAMIFVTESLGRQLFGIVSLGRQLLGIVSLDHLLFGTDWLGCYLFRTDSLARQLLGTYSLAHQLFGRDSL